MKLLEYLERLLDNYLIVSFIFFYFHCFISNHTPNREQNIKDNFHFKYLFVLYVYRN